MQKCWTADGTLYCPVMLMMVAISSHVGNATPFVITAPADEKQLPLPVKPK